MENENPIHQTPKSNKLFVIIIAILVITAGGLIFAISSRSSQNNPSVTAQATDTPVVPTGVKHTINLIEDGYEPAELTINKGDEVVFTTSLGKEHWPASDLHPTHRIYPEFDPKEPVAADKSWSFVFGKVGTWGYHDHLWSSYRGKITVTE